MSFVVLWTDSFVYGIGLILLYLFLFRRNNLQWNLVWQKVFSQSRYTVALIVLICFSFIGLLDTIHLKRSESHHQVVSLLDLAFGSRAWQNEVTYSAPFALRSYAPEMVFAGDGNFGEVYPRLEYAGQQLGSESERAQDIALRSVRGLFLGALISYFLFLVFDHSVFKKIQWFLRGSFSNPLSHHNEKDQVFVNTSGSLKKLRMTFWLTIGIISCLICVSAVLLSEYHILGTDKVGRDVFYIAIKSIRTGLIIGTLTTLVSLPFALILGMCAGYFSGIIDDIIQYIYVTLSSIPGILLIAATVLSLQVKIEQDPDLRLIVLCLILGITSWTSLCRLLRGETLKLREMEFIQAATVLGVGGFKNIWRHILPNLLHIVIIVLVLDFSGLVLAEAVLTYVGVGVDPLTHSWGNMINMARLEMARDPIVWWSLAGALVLMFSLVFSANIFSEAIQDALNPRSD